MLADAFFDGALSFSFVENKKFKEFLNFICPSFKPPTRRKIATELLDKSFTETKVKVVDILKKEKLVTLGIVLSFFFQS